MARSKRVKLDPATDRLIGIQQRNKLDLFAGCNEPGKEWFMPDAHAFMRVWCRHCKSPECIRAGAGGGPWQARMQAQVDYLINDPKFSELETAEHKALAAMVFESLNAKAQRLEIAARRQDWSIPEEQPSDGIDRLASPDTTSSFDEAVKELARAQGKKEPNLPVPEQAQGPTHFQQQDEEPESESEEDEDEDLEEPEEDPNAPEYETQYPSTDGKRRYHVVLSKQGRWSCACEGFKHVRKCKHLDTVRAWYEEELDRLQQEELAAKEEARIQEVQRRQAPPVQARPVQPSAPVLDPRVPTHRPLNTPMPTTGVMVGGAAPPPPTAPSRPPREAPDAWTPRQETVVEPGATVTLKPRKK
jgi:hypothetical protein